MNMLQTLAKNHDWNLPTVCPVCGSALTLSENHVRLSCVNEFCPSRASGTIAKWCSVIGIKEMGLTTIEKIQEQGFFSAVGKAYRELEDTAIDAYMIPLLGKNWTNIRKEFDAHRDMTLAQLVAGYNIPGIGEKQVQKVIDSFKIKKLEDFFDDVNPGRFTCDGIGFILSQKLSNGLEANKADMLETVRHIRLISPVKAAGKLSGKSFCFTGAMEYRRKDLQDMVTANGGINLDSVTKNLTYLVCENLNTKSNKYKNAIKYNVKCITLKEFMQLLKC